MTRTPLPFLMPVLVLLTIAAFVLPPRVDVASAGAYDVWACNGFGGPSWSFASLGIRGWRRTTSATTARGASPARTTTAGPAELALGELADANARVVPSILGPGRPLGSGAGR